MSISPHQSIDNSIIANTPPQTANPLPSWLGVSEIITALIVAALGAMIASTVDAFRKSGFSQIEDKLIDPLSQKIDLIEQKIAALNLTVDHAKELYNKCVAEAEHYRRDQLQTASELATIKANLLIVSELLAELKHDLRAQAKHNEH